MHRAVKNKLLEVEGHVPQWLWRRQWTLHLGLLVNRFPVYRTAAETRWPGRPVVGLLVASNYTLIGRGLLFSERSFAICYRPSVCRLSVCNVPAPYSGGSNFRQYFYGIRYLGHPVTFIENFTQIVPAKPLRRGS